MLFDGIKTQVKDFFEHHKDDISPGLYRLESRLRTEKKFVFEREIFPFFYLNTGKESHKNEVHEQWAMGSAYNFVSQTESLNSIDLLKEVRSFLNRYADEQTNIYSALRFDSQSHDSSIWQPLTRGVCFLPQVELIKQADEYRIIINIFVNNPEDIEKLKENIFDTLNQTGVIFKSQKVVVNKRNSNSSIEKSIQKKEVPVKQDWRRLVNDTLGRIKKHEAEKVVLARMAYVDLEKNKSDNKKSQAHDISQAESFDYKLYDIIQELHKNNSNTVIFACANDRHATFLGATPEKIFQNRNGVLTSEALAGTVKASDDKKKNRERSQELLNSEKDIREHNFVRDAIEKALGKYATDIQKSEIKVRHLRTVQHLLTEFKARLLDTESDIDLLSEIHPSPAISGTPVDKALSIIMKTEPFDRGLYAGILGIVQRKSSDFYVALRSGLITDQRLYIFAGAGIVEGSEAEKEWQETENKMTSLVQLLHRHLFNHEEKS